MSDLDTALRDMLRTRAADVMGLPTHLADPTTMTATTTVRPGRPAGRSRVLAVAASVVALVALGTGCVLALRHTDRPTTLPPTRTGNAVPTSCRTALPGAWAQAVARGTSHTGAATVAPLAMFPDGRVVVSRDFGSARDVALLAANGRATSIYQVPSPDEDQAVAAQVEGNTVLIQVARLPRHANGVMPVIARLVVVDPGLGLIDVARVPDVGSRNPSRYIDGAAMLDGKVYFDVRPSYASTAGKIYARDLNKVLEPAKLVFTGPVTAPNLFYDGVGWTPNSSRVSVPRDVPEAVRSRPRFRSTSGYVPGNPPAVSDGTVYAWADSQHVIGWYDGRTATRRSFNLATTVRVAAVTGDYMLYSRTDDAALDGLQAWVLDVRTGATAPLHAIIPQAVAGAGVLALTVSDQAKGSTAVVRIDTATLPGLTC